MGDESIPVVPENGNFNVGPKTKPYQAKSSGFLSMADASKITGYHQDYLGQMARSGKLEATKIGRKWVVSKEALEKLLGETSGQEVLGGELPTEVTKNEQEVSANLAGPIPVILPEISKPLSLKSTYATWPAIVAIIGLI